MARVVWHSKSGSTSDPSRAIRTDTQTGCTDICGQIGTTCSSGQTLGLDDVLGAPIGGTPPFVCTGGACIGGP